MYTTGYKYQHITIINIYKENLKDKNRTMADVRCDCGEVFSKLLTLIKLNRIKQCKKCSNKIKKEKFSQYIIEHSYTESNRYMGYMELPKSIFCQYKANAARRNIDFNITIEYMYHLYEKQNKKCFFTDIELSFNPKNNNASLDRINSTIGYVEGNLIWVYKPLNTMKRSLSIDEFIKYCCLIAKHNNL